MVTKPNSIQYVKLECEYSFGISEGKEMIRDSHPQATEIKHLNAKMVKMLGLKSMQPINL